MRRNIIVTLLLSFIVISSQCGVYAINPVIDKGAPVINQSDDLQAELDSAISDKSIKEQNDERRGAELVDSVMVAGGLLCISIPMIFMFVYLMSKVNYSIFGRLFNWMTFKRLTAVEINTGKLALRLLIVISIGVLLITGWIKEFIILIWSEIMQHGLL